jgi:hypothetical protein
LTSSANKYLTESLSSLGARIKEKPYGNQFKYKIIAKSNYRNWLTKSIFQAVVIFVLLFSLIWQMYFDINRLVSLKFISTYLEKNLKKQKSQYKPKPRRVDIQEIKTIIDYCLV